MKINNSEEKKNVNFIFSNDRGIKINWVIHKDKRRCKITSNKEFNKKKIEKC